MVPGMRIINLGICLAVAACTTSGPTDPPDDPVDPACAVDTGSASSSRAVDTGELAWRLDRGLDSDQPVCSDSDPACDAMAETDTPEDDRELMVDDVQAPLDETLDGTDNDNVAMALTELTNGKYRAWPHGRIPYVFKKVNGSYVLNSATRATVSKAMTNWETKTEGRVKFRAKTSTDKEYITITVGSPKVSPFVGHIAGRTSTVYLRQNEFITVSKHELGHVVGLHHEQRRSDRLSYIQVRTANIVNSTLCKYQFSVCSTCKKIGTYDRISVMHYRTSDLGNCRTGPVLLKLDGTAIQHYWQLSTKDVNAVKVMYPSMVTPPPPPPTTTPTLPEMGSIVNDKACVAVSSGSMDPGAALDTRTCDGMGDQDWRLTTDGQLLVQHSMQCAAVSGCSTAGATLQQTTCSATAPDQKWTLDDVEIVNGKTDKCLDASSGTAVTFAACSGDPAQKFDYRAETETIELNGMCVTAATDAANVGDALVLAACDGRDAQKWLQARGGFVPRANTGRCLDIASGVATGTKAALADCNDSIDQRWALRGSVRDGRSGLCIAAGAPLSLAECDGSAGQTWTFWSR
jgi:hypothetical protein